jgi:uncharacterized protein (DUF305 family)
MHTNSKNEICVTPLGLTIIVLVFVVITIILLWGYAYYRLVGNPFSSSEFQDLPAPVWQGGFDCPLLPQLPILNANIQKPCDVIAPVLAAPDRILTDTQFLEYMIAHHQVAVNMAKQVLRSSQNQYILELARKMVWQQGYEITMMHAMLGRLPQPFSRVAVLGHYNTSLLSFYKGFDVEPVKCYDDMFTGDASVHLPHMSDRAFLAHMSAHHELGLAMARAQLNRSGSNQSGFMLSLLYDIIHEQEQELDRMRGLSSSTLWETSRVIGH